MRISGLNHEDFDNEDELEDDSDEEDFGGKEWDDILPIQKIDSLYADISN